MIDAINGGGMNHLSRPNENERAQFEGKSIAIRIVDDSDLILIAMKEMNRHDGQFSGGVSRFQMLISEKRAKLPTRRETGFPIAEQGEADNMDPCAAEPSAASRIADGQYIFVTMPNGEIRLSSNSQNGTNAHGALAGASKYVLYAGKVTFRQGLIEKFSNESGTYVPPAFLRYQAGFSASAGFQDCA